MLTKSKAISAKGSPTNMSATYFKQNMGSFPLTTTSCQTKDTQFPQFSINIQASLPQETPQPSVDTPSSKQLSLSSSLQPTTSFVGLLDRHTFYAADFSLFGPKAFHRKSLTESSYLHSSTPKKSQLGKIAYEDESKKIQEESFEAGIRLDKPLHTELSEFKVPLNSTKSSKSQSTLRGKKLDSNSISRSNATPLRVNRPVTTKHIPNKSVIVFPSSNEGLHSAKNSTQAGKPYGHSPMSTSNKKLSLNQPGFEVLDPSLTKSTPVSYILASKGEIRTPSNVMKTQQPEPSHFDKKAIKKSKRIEQKNSRFSLDNYQRLGKSAADFAGKPNYPTEASPKKGTPKSHLKPKNLSVSQAPTQPLIGKLDIQKTNPGEVLRNVSDLDESLNIEILDKVIHEEDIDGSDHKIKVNGDNKELKLDNMESYTSIEHVSDSEREVSLIQSSFIFEKLEDNRSDCNLLKTPKDTKEVEPEETFEEFFSRSVSYMCEVIDGKDPKTSRDSKKTHEDQLSTLLDLIIKRIHILKKDRDDITERISTGKKLLILLDMSLRSMICLIRRKEISVRRLFNKSCGGGKLNEKKNASIGNEYKLKFEELCNIEGASCEKNEKDVRDRLCQAILKRKEELGDLEKALKDAKQENTLQYVKVVNIKVCNILKNKPKAQGK